ncbi:hypothetical protein DRN76_03015, partial [Methanosarcinales archaeon]
KTVPMGFMLDRIPCLVAVEPSSSCHEEIIAFPLYKVLHGEIDEAGEKSRPVLQRICEEKLKY